MQLVRNSFRVLLIVGILLAFAAFQICKAITDQNTKQLREAVPTVYAMPPPTPLIGAPSATDDSVQRSPGSDQLNHYTGW